MSELQTALLLIGVGVMVVVYGYGWWQQRRLSKKFGAAFKASHSDALYRENSNKPLSPVQHTVDVAQTVVHQSEPAADEPVADADEPVTVSNVLDESCALLDGSSDFIIDLQLQEPATGALLGGFWQRKFDFGKPVQVCGLTLNGQRWERVIAESQTLYVSLRIAVQLVDRGGVISATKLADFRDLIMSVARQNQADTTLPDLAETHARAVELDALCESVDQMVGINLIPSGERLLLASSIAQAAALHDMKLESDGAFHLFNEQGVSLFSLINQDKKPFQHHTLANATSSGVTLLLDVPRATHPALQFDAMNCVARELAQELQLNLVDDQRVVLSATGLDRIRAQIVAVDATMRDNAITPGSARARRLFS